MMTFFSRVYAVCCVLMAIWLGVQFAQHTPIQTQLTALLPQEQVSTIFHAADQFQEQQLNQQIILLVGANDSEKAFQAANEVAQTWQNSGYFAGIDGKIEPDLTQLQQSVRQLGAAILPAPQIQQLYDNPQQYFAERAEAAANPFAGSLLSLEQDWLGFSRFILEKQGNSQLRWHSEHAMLYTEIDGKTWVWLRARLPQTAPNVGLLDLWRSSKTQAQAQSYTLLATGGALFAADAKQNAERESSIMSAIGLTLTFALLLAMFHSWRVLWLALPLGVGVLSGLTASLLVFGEIHALTLVVGTSLVGVLVDFPLHWLASSLFAKQPALAWHGALTMRRLLPSFWISLLITVLGYLLLWFTPLPVLRQTAIFSAAALLGAFAATVLFLPILLRAYQAKTTLFSHGMTALAGAIQSHRWQYILAAIWLTCAAGVTQTQWQDDIRQWASMRPDLLADAQQIAQISGMGAGQTVLITATSPDDLLQQSQQVEHALQQAHIAQVQSLNQWILPVAEQKRLKQRLAELAKQPALFAPLVDLGIPAEIVQAALNQAAQTPVQPLVSSLNAPQAEAFRSLYLGEIDGKWVGLARLSNVRGNVQAALPPSATLLDKRIHLNEQFTATRNQAAWLKIGSFVLAWGVLCWLFGARRGSLILAVPLLAVAGTVGILGWLNMAIGLFPMFGLLLASAIGVDYAVYVLNAPESLSARLAGITLAALTTEISFALLAWSSTPAVAAFGISVSVGVLLNWLGGVCLLRVYSGFNSN
ncbi:hypothetical protein QG041_03850 [Kingella kingae]|uniref:MMPL family transporter n=1 Tax=Kingella kingae TaxID=504 RepID=UPI00025845E5|nr:hypothetical protein [Kingella kingae]EIC13710.1 hypothetical protein KKB_04738 [Kingella kingae PYKK081]MDK4568460.1 hypothetical protein [Kingella kingae]MDK4570423.1 hypothetical protein [Kingella kingae]MDK4572350.1 hypothetical protein [Kingella kingae]MDK4616429.1 hypothetical protein [Kingella kingae]